MFVDHKTKEFYLSYSTECAIKAVASDLTELRQGVFNAAIQNSYNRGDLEIEIVKEYATPPILGVIRPEYDAIAERYKADGYKDTRSLIQMNYKLTKRILIDFRRPRSHCPPLVYVTAKSQSKGELVLAIFNTVPQADRWIAEVYGEQTERIVPKFREDEITLEYQAKYGYKLVVGKTRVRGNLKKRFNGITL